MLKKMMLTLLLVASTAGLTMAQAGDGCCNQSCCSQSSCCAKK
jgi:hypothetical protein